MQPDAHFYATLMGVVGAAGDLRLALRLREEMALDGLPPCQVKCPPPGRAPCPWPWSKHWAKTHERLRAGCTASCLYVKHRCAPGQTGCRAEEHGVQNIENGR